MLCDRQSARSIQQYLSQLSEFLSLYTWIVDAYVSDYFTQNHWDNVPVLWKKCLEDTEPTELAWLLKDGQVPRVWPLSLLAFRQCTQTYSLTRSQLEVKVHDFSKLDLHGSEQDVKTSLNSLDEPKSEKAYTEYLKKHVKPKKLHEIECLGKTLRVLGDVCDCQQIVDVGAGQGHLSRLLTFQHGFKVTTVEAEGCHAPKAQKYDRDAQKQILKAKQKRGHDETESEADLPNHVTCYITANTTEGEFLDVVQRSFRRTNVCSGHCGWQHNTENLRSPGIEPKQSRLVSESKRGSDSNLLDVAGVSTGRCSTDSYKEPRQLQEQPHSDTSCDKCRPSSTSDCSQTSDHISCRSRRSSSGRDTDRRFLLTGLHACGDLTPTMLRVFTSCPDVQGVASVSCCYMKLSTAGNIEVTPAGYPMSDFVSNLPHSALSYEAREMACHFADSYLQRLKDSPPSLKLHCYRAALQWIILQLQPNFVTGAQKLTIRKAESLTFPQYVKLGLHRLGLDSDVPEEMLEKGTALLVHWREVVAFYTIRLSLSPVVETLLLLDRQLYLYERGISSLLKPVFDPKTSPRNFVLLARK